jgi:hypothetical protein
MTQTQNSFPFPTAPARTEPFASAEAAWFWCVETSEALHSGARLRAGMGKVSRPCEPVDIQNVILRLARQKLLNDAHLRTLGRYGQRQLRPDPTTGLRDASLWHQAMNRLTPVLQRKGIIA